MVVENNAGPLLRYSDMTKLLTLDELAERLRTTRNTILNQRVRNPDAVPPAVKLPGTRKLLWREEDVEAFVAKHVTPSPQGEGKPPRGRN